MFGRCIKDDEANYYLWGLMNRLCGKLKQTAYGNAMTWKLVAHQHTAQVGVIWAIQLGYAKGDDAGISPIKGVSNCPIGCGEYIGNLSYEWYFPTYANILKGVYGTLRDTWKSLW
jgi:hypothetical protein